jgi:hypothetical protein
MPAWLNPRVRDAGEACRRTRCWCSCGYRALAVVGAAGVSRRWAAINAGAVEVQIGILKSDLVAVLSELHGLAGLAVTEAEMGGAQSSHWP